MLINGVRVEGEWTTRNGSTDVGFKPTVFVAQNNNSTFCNSQSTPFS